VKILLLGNKGALGSAICKELIKKKVPYYSLNRNQYDPIKNFKQIDLLLKKGTTLVINCISLNGIKFCEENPKLAFKVNSNFPIILSKFLSKRKINLINFSTEAVYSGYIKKKLYSENIKAKPNTIYGKSKLYADNYLIKMKNAKTIRLPLLFGPTHKKQIIYKLLKQLNDNKKIYVSNDIFSTPIYTPALCDKIINLVVKIKFEHIGSVNNYYSKYYSMFDLIKKFAVIMKKKNFLIEVNEKYFKSDFIKPKNLGLTSKKKNHFIKNPNFFKILYDLKFIKKK
jgi:dTDP-4-dehydrorhamnose reductase